MIHDFPAEIQSRELTNNNHCTRAFGIYLKAKCTSHNAVILRVEVGTEEYI